MTMKTHSNRIRLSAFVFLLAVQAPFIGSAFAAEKQSLRAEVGAPLQEAQKALQAKDYKGALAKINAAEAVGKLTSYESYIINSLKASAALGGGDYKTALTAFEQVLESPELPPAEKLQKYDAYVKIAYASKDYNKTAEAIEKYKAAGGSNAETLGLYVQSLYLAGKYKEAGVELASRIKSLEAAGKRAQAERHGCVHGGTRKDRHLYAQARLLARPDAAHEQQTGLLAESHARRLSLAQAHRNAAEDRRLHGGRAARSAGRFPGRSAGFRR
jgi:tetratricopeptide (TPR) repeat protein